jgi:predicted TPR repeat methyltransferase
LGIAFRQLGKTADSLRAFRIAATIAPGEAEAHFNLGQALLASGDAPHAIETLQQALRVRADFPAAERLLGSAYGCCGQFDDAVACYRRALPQVQGLAQIYGTIGTSLMTLQAYPAALVCFRKSLGSEPDQPLVRHLVAALEGQNPERPPNAYVEQLFDGYAEEFDQRLVADLRYVVPHELAKLASEFTSLARPWDALDLGCGTGLFGAEISARARHLVGVDLSAKMLDKARERHVYARLEHADIRTAVDSEPAAAYDLIAAADVFIYVGRLDAIVAGIRRLLRPGGCFVFSVEAGAADGPVAADSAVPEAGYRLCATGRYAHGAAYLDRLAVENRFSVRCMRTAALRIEHQRPVQGWLVAWQS